MLVSSPITPALDQLSDLALWEAELAEPAVVESSLVRRLSQVPDRRKRRGRRHPLVAVLVLTACATLVVGNDSIAAIWQWSTGASQEKLKRIGARRDALRDRFTVPSERTFRRVMADLDADALDLATCGYAADVVRGQAPAPLIPRTPGPAEREERRAAQRAAGRPALAGTLPGAAIDGKALRGARTTEGGRVFLVAAMAHVSSIVLGQRQVPDKRGESTVVQELLAPLDLAGMVLTLDALHTTKKTARLITKTLSAHYLLILKGNQPLAREAARILLAGPDSEFTETTATEDDRGHARIERRSLRTAPADHTLFPGAQQVFRLRRDTGDLDGDWTSKEVVLGVTSLPTDLAGPAHLNYHERQHWTVENRLHWVRDVTFHEDNSQVRTGTAPRALASFRNLGINAFRLADRTNIAHARRDLHHRDDAFTAYGI